MEDMKLKTRFKGQNNSQKNNISQFHFQWEAIYFNGSKEVVLRWFLKSPTDTFPMRLTFCCPERDLQMFSTSHDDKHAVHEIMKSRVQAFNCGILQKGQQDGL